MRAGARTSNRIDGLLTKMMENPSSVRYLPNIDKNLDYLFTSLQLDLIDIIAQDVAAAEETHASAGKCDEEPTTTTHEERPDILAQDL